MRQRDERRFEAALVTCRHVHVAKLCVRCDQASPGTDGDEGAVAAFLPGMQPFELSRAPIRASASCRSSMWPVDSAFLAGEPGARVERAVGADRVRVLHVHVARAVVHAVGRREAVPLGLLAQERHLVVEEVAGVARRAPPPAPADVMHVPPSGFARAVAPTGVSGSMPLPAAARTLGSGLRTIGLKLTLTSLSAKSCSLQEIEQRRVAVDRALVEVAADRDPAPGRRPRGCSRRSDRTCPGRRAAAASGCACRGRRRA